MKVAGMKAYKGPTVFTKVKIKIKLYEGTFLLHVFCHVMATGSKLLKEYYKWLRYLDFIYDL